MDITDNICDHWSIEERWMKIIISFINGYRIDFVSLCSWRPMLSVPIVMLRRLLCFRTQLWYIWQNEKTPLPNGFVLLSFRHRLEGQWDWNFPRVWIWNLIKRQLCAFKKHGMKSYEELKKTYSFCFEYHAQLLKCKTVYWCIALFLTRYNKKKIKKR